MRSKLDSAGSAQVRTLDAKGFPEVTFRGEYPIGRVTYADPQCAGARRIGGVFAVHSAERPGFGPAGDGVGVHGHQSEPGTARDRPDGLAAKCHLSVRKIAPVSASGAIRCIQQDGVATLEGTVEASPGKGLETRHGFGSMALSLIGADAASLRGGADVRLPLDAAAFGGAFSTPAATATRTLDGDKLIGSLRAGIHAGSRRQPHELSFFSPGISHCTSSTATSKAG